MDSPLHEILKASGSIQLAVLRCRTPTGHQNIHARIATDDGNVVHCIIDEKLPGELRAGIEVHLVQKKNDNYFFIAGQVRERVGETPCILAISITRAFWFERKSRGHVSWLREKYRYEEMQLAS